MDNTIQINVLIPTEWQLAKFALEKNIIQAKFLRCKQALHALGLDIPLTIVTLNDVYFPFQNIDKFKLNSEGIPKFIRSLSKRTDIIRQLIHNQLMSRFPSLTTKHTLSIKKDEFIKIFDEMMNMRTQLITLMIAGLQRDTLDQNI